MEMGDRGVSDRFLFEYFPVTVSSLIQRACDIRYDGLKLLQPEFDQ